MKLASASPVRLRLNSALGWSAVLLVGAQLISACGKQAPNENVNGMGNNAGNGNAGNDDDDDDDDDDGNSSSGGKGNKPGDGGNGAGASSNDDDASAPNGGNPDGGETAPDGGTVKPLPPPPEFTKPGLLEALADCALESYRDFQGKANALVDATEALANDATDARLTAARNAWRSAIASWQRAEPFRFGPAARSPQPGAQNLRDQIYIFPLANYCRVDQQIVNQAYANAGFATTLASTRGLSTLEYLLFHTGSSNSCLSAVNINSDGSWAALSADERAERRADYAAAAAKDVLAKVTTLIDAWDPNEGDFYDVFTTAGDGSNLFPLHQDAFNAVNDGLFYIEKEVKDWKLGWPLGLVPDCVNTPGTCPDAVESRYAKASTDHIRQNLIGFRRAFEGCEDRYWGLGFDDWLNAVGADDLSGRMLAAIVNAQEVVDDLDPPVEEAIVSNADKVRAVHTAVKAITDPLKTEFVTVLDLELPKSAEGDND